MKTEQQLRERIMRQVHGVYFLRQLSHPAVRLGALLVLLLSLRELTFVSKVIENASLKHDALGFANYMLYAFSGTELIVQFVVIAVCTVTAFIIKDTVASLRPQQLPA